MRSPLAILAFATLACLVSATGARAQIDSTTVVQFIVGSPELSDEARTALDAFRRDHPPGRWTYWFEGDHDATRFRNMSLAASTRLSERLAESRWQSVAAHLGVPPMGSVRSTGRLEVRVYAARIPVADPRQLAALADSVASLRRAMLAVPREVTTLAPAPAPPETVLAVGRIEKLWLRSDKWARERWWESGLGAEIGLLRVEPAQPGKRTGATLILGDGTFAWQPFQVTLRPDVFRLGWRRFGLTPALRWYDWALRIHYGDDQHADTSWFSNSDPVYLLGIDLDAYPWDGAFLHLTYAGVGARVHANHRPVTSYDHYDLRFDQRLASRWWLEAQAVYDERFEKALCYSALWLARGWGMQAGEFSVRLGFAYQLDALAATTGRRDEIFEPTISLGFEWRRFDRFAVP